MIYEIDLLSKPSVDFLNNFYEKFTYKKGLMSGDKQDDRKNNKEAQVDENYLKASELFVEKVQKHVNFNDIFSIKRFTAPLFSEYDKGMEYNFHNDCYEMYGCRTDLSCTCFISDPASYEGGELEITIGNIPTAYKLEAGKALVYPSSTIHRVKPIISGKRRVVVFWIESQLQDPSIREMHSQLSSLWIKHRETLLNTDIELYNGIMNLKFQLLRLHGTYNKL